MNRSDPDSLLTRANDGDADALQHLLIRCHAKLAPVTQRLLGPTLRRRHDPEDVIQDAFVAAFRTAGRYRFETLGVLEAWLRRVVENRVADLHRAVRTRKRDARREESLPPAATSSYPDLAARLAATDSTPSRRAVRKETMAILLTSLARLPDDQRVAVRLRFLEGRSVSEVAAELGKSEDNVYSLTYRGLRSLRQRVQALGDSRG